MKRKSDGVAGGGPGGASSAGRRGRVAGRYLVDEVLGRGGMAVVYRVTDEVTGARLALKRLQPTTSQADTAARLFEREFHTLSQLRHPRIIEVYGYGVDEDGPYYTMELLEGRDLREATPLAVLDACRCLRDVASCLSLLHARRLVHRDVSPRNVRLTPDGGAKLIDFGALATHGTSARCVGTPPGIAPEALSGLPLDPRVDLYSLGALAYWALTGRHAYPARRTRDLTALWRIPAAPPSRYNANISPALDALVMSMLNLNPLARPASAAEVIERLEAVMGHASSAESANDAGDVLHSNFVGRDSILEQLDTALGRLQAREGAAILLEAGSGYGRSRLLSEMFVHAQLRGVDAVHMQVTALGRPHATIEVLLERLLDAAPAHTEAALSAHWPVLRAALPTLRERFDPAVAFHVAPAPDHAERRVRVQTALCACLHDIARRAPLMLLIDDVHRADDESIFTLAALAHSIVDTPLMVVATALDRDVPGTPLLGLRQQCRPMTLPPFDHDDVLQMVHSLFGEVVHSARLARWLGSTTGGSPWGCMSLLEHLVQGGVIQRRGGAWLLPDRYDDHDLPRSVEQAISRRIATLSPGCLELARALSICRGAITLPLIARLGANGSIEQHTHLQVLLERGLLVQSEDRYRFAQQQLRDALAEQLSPAGLSAMHLRVGRALEATGCSGPVDRLVVGEHLVRGGATVDGERLVFQAVDHLMSQGGEGLQFAAEFLEETLERLRAQGRTPRECLRLVVPLSAVALHGDREPTERHFQQAFAGLLRATGVAAASRLAPYLGGRLALYVGVSWASLRELLRPRRVRLGGVRERFSRLFMSASAGFAVAAASLDLQAANLVVAELGVFRLFARSHPARLLYEVFSAMRDQLEGRLGDAEARVDELLQRLESPAIRRGLTAEQRDLLRAGLLASQAHTIVYRQDVAALECAETLEAQGLQSWSAMVANVHLAYYALRGESARAEHYRREMDAHLLRGGWTWKEDWANPGSLVFACGLTGDVVGLRALSEQLARYALERASFWPIASYVRALHRLAQGKPSEALEILEPLQAQVGPYRHIHWAGMRSAYAMALRALGRPQAARDVCIEALGQIAANDRRYTVLYQPLERELALAEAESGALAAAATRLDALLADGSTSDNPLTRGLLHRDRARVALLARAAGSFEHHLARMAYSFSLTENSLLVAQVEKLRDEAVLAGLIGPLAGASRSVLLPSATLSWIDGLRATPDGELRCQAALDMLMQRAGASGGQLHLLSPSGLVPVVGEDLQAAPERLEPQLLAFLNASVHADDVTQTVTHAGRSDPAPDLRVEFIAAGHLRYRPHLLRIIVDGQYEPIGVVALCATGRPLRVLSQGFLDAIARTLCEGTGVSTEAPGPH